MKIFTYEDYKKYSEFMKASNPSTEHTLMEPSAKYELLPKSNKIDASKIINKYDKTFKTILENKEEAVNLINKVLDFEQEIKAEELEKYNSSFITRSFIAQESDIIYKIKNKKIFILIEHQTKIDYSMAYRILNYQIEIMRSCIEEKKVKNKDYKHALVIAIVLYTGKQKWKAKKDIREIQENLYDYSLADLDYYGGGLGNYNIVDINQYTETELLKSKSFLSKIMLLEKSKNKEETLRNLEKIIPIIKQEDKETLLRIINYRFKEYFDNATLKQIIKKIREEGDGTMLAVVEMLEEEKQKQERETQRRVLKEVRKEVRKEVQKEKQQLARKMLEENISIKLIEKITGLKKEKFM